MFSKFKKILYQVLNTESTWNVIEKKKKRKITLLRSEKEKFEGKKKKIFLLIRTNWKITLSTQEQEKAKILFSLTNKHFFIFIVLLISS